MFHAASAMNHVSMTAAACAGAAFSCANTAMIMDAILLASMIILPLLRLHRLTVL